MLVRLKNKILRASMKSGGLNPTLNEIQVAAFENEHGVTLPAEYRTFLREIGNGGLGPGDGLSTLAEAAKKSPTSDLDKPFPFSFRLYQEERARFAEDLRTHSVERAITLANERCGGPPRDRREMKYAQPGVLYLATPDDPWASVYLVITGEDRGMVWMYGHIECGWNPEAPTSADDERQINKPPRNFLHWYEDWLDEVLSREAPDAESGVVPPHGNS